MRVILALALLLVACKQRPTFHDAPPRPSAGDPRGTFSLTYYWVTAEPAVAADAKPAATVTIYDKTCTPLANVSAKFANELSLAGAGKLADDRMLSVAGDCACKRSPCFRVIDHAWGLGANNRPLVPFRSIAVDRKMIPIGTTLWIEQLDGADLPGTFPSVHDGCVVADDVGGRIVGEKVDWFVGRQPYYVELNEALRLRDVQVFDGGERCP
jgi:3D (Asp-Asp-Asp) domain-containing protein